MDYYLAHFDALAVMTSPQVKVDDFLLPASRGEAHEVRSWLTVPELKMENVSMNGLSWSDNDTSWNNSGVEEFLQALEYNPIGGLGHYGTVGQDDIELGVLDELMGGFRQVDNFLAANEIGREYEGFLLNQDISATGKDFKRSPIMSAGSVPSSSSESQSPGISTGNNVVFVGSAESSTASLLDTQFKTGSVSNTSICLQEIHETKIDFQVTAGDSRCSYPDCHDQESRDQIDTKPSATQENLKTCSCSCSPGWRSSGKRSKRYVRKGSGVNSYDQERCKDTEKEFLNGTVVQTPHESSPRRLPRKRRPVFMDIKPDDIYTSSESEDDCKDKTLRSKKTNVRRKRQVMWTTTEVSKLIEGVAQLGLGKWTDIKKLHFSSSAHRTPIDLRDKWRNLVRRASSNPKKKRWNQGVGERPVRHVLPEALTLRVMELASNHHPQPTLSRGRYMKKKKKK